ncbi:ABC transporter ATP-binding protein/permease [Kaistia dalseonensis]|uniref:ATP-binding cassette transporter n=1 Tax=Kaistia dalseonensis TaxID=410840 RepID=A0ABU0HEP0_9HYPH|nr:ABC transporter ATP-binding protein/permease [Kaistia dalseonensis]MCX5497339.1 ABC transporter ATP-binding protein/permease [Kaistia dalseonensis]MDQ0439976.1 putative ATP-binding cassette transporter [Kaistia dalseonensis]
MLKLKSLKTLLRTIGRTALPYYRSDEKWFALGMLGLVIGLQLFGVWLDVRFNRWNNDFYTALQQKDWTAFAYQMFVVFSWIAALSIISGVYQTYLSQWLRIRWRKWMTGRYLSDWMGNGTHYRMRLSGNPADNPDQRIAEDTQRFVDGTLSIGVALLGQIVTLVSFIVILWNMSASNPIVLFGQSYVIPGYLVWTALIYAVVGTILAHLIGKPLVKLNFDQQRYEADFRFALIRNRENGEEIALLKGEPAERATLGHRFNHVVGNFYDIMIRQKWLNFFQSGYTQVAVIFPFIVVSPLYFSGTLELGGLMATASAFGMVRSALSFFVTAYDTLADWKAVVDRLDGFEKALGKAVAEEKVGPALAADRADRDLAIRDLVVRLPDGREIVDVPALTFAPRERVLVTGPSGSGKTSLFRALGGIWPFGGGGVHIPAGADLLILPQHAYMPLGTLKTALAYPAPEADLADADAETMLELVGLAGLVPSLHEAANWGNRLSGGEQQRIAIARALIAKPDWLLLDEATSALDEKAEADVYGLIRQRLPETTIISIGHRSSLAALHDRFLQLVEKEGGRHTVVEAKAPVLAPA